MAKCTGPDCEECARYCREGWTCEIGTLAGEEVEIYLRSLREDAPVPRGFWVGEQGGRRRALIVRFALVHIAGVGLSAALLRHVSTDLLIRLHLETLLVDYGPSLYTLIDTAFPDYELMPWQFRRPPQRYWQQPGAALAALRWFLHRQGWTAAECAQQLITNATSVYTLLEEDGLSYLEYQGRKQFLTLLSAIDPWIHPGLLSFQARPSTTTIPRQAGHPPPKTNARLNKSGIMIPASQWNDTGWAVFQMNEWSEGLEVRAIPPPAVPAPDETRTAQWRASIRVRLPSDLVQQIRPETRIRILEGSRVLLLFTSDMTRDRVWAWLQLRRSHDLLRTPEKREKLRRSALRQEKRDGTTSKYLRVSWSKGQQRWRAMITVDGKTVFCRSFLNEEDAARAADAKARELYGDKARLNFPGEQEHPNA